VSQLDALGDVARLLDGEGIECWLFGGWAVDFWLGRVTREHTDVDLAIWLDDMPRIAALLAGTGWTDLNDPDADGGKAFGRDGVRLELTYLRRDDEGVYTPLRDGTRGRWSEESLGSDVLELDGIRCRVIARAPLTRMKRRGRGGDADDAAKDSADADRLERSAPAGTELEPERP
jgi:hypothetical protein